MIYFHGTNKENKELIRKEGFKASYGRFGQGVYFTSDMKEAKGFGCEVIEVTVPKDQVTEIYYPSLKDIYPHLSIEEEEGVTGLRDYVISFGYSAVEIEYVTGEKELCVYDSNIIKIIN